MLAVIAVTLGYIYFSRNLPELSSLSDYQPPLVSRIYNTQGELLADYADEHRILTPLASIPKQLRNAFLAAEDQQFYEHPGINPARILSAALANLRAGHTVQGGSTITQQVAKNFLLTPEKNITRKIREAILSYRIEQAFSKDDILYLYLNQIYLGRGSYGVASAAWRYFGKRLDELTLGECAMLAGLPKAPSKYAPHLNPDLATDRRNTVLTLMRNSAFASARDVEQAMHEHLQVIDLPGNALLSAYGNDIYRQLTNRFGLNTLRRQGLTIITPYEPSKEQTAIRSVREGLLELEQRQLYRAPVNHPEKQWEGLLAKWRDSYPNPDPSQPLRTDQVIPALIEKVEPNGDLLANDGHHIWPITAPSWRWKTIEQDDNNSEPQHPHHWLAGDEIALQGMGNGGVRLTQMPSIESALYSVDLEHGTVIARVGGFDFAFGGFDRVSQAHRQPGSAFKPLLYATAIERGYTPASILMDTPVVFDNSYSDNFWRPENYKNRFAGPVTLRNALEHSRNLASIKLLQDVGIRNFTSKLKDFSFDHDFPNQLALALGATEVTLEQLTEAYIVLADHGQKWSPVSIQQVQDRNGRSLHRAVAGNRCQVCHVEPVLSVGEGMRPATQVLDPVSSYLMTNILKGVIDRGTGIRARQLGRPAAGKTGTTNDQIDAWFMGYTPQILTGVWTGKDSPSSMGRRETGAHAALPTWLSFMKQVSKGQEKKEFQAPDGIEWALIDPDTGKLAGVDTRKPFLEAFRQGTAPGEVSTTPSNNPDASNQSPTQDFFDTPL